MDYIKDGTLTIQARTIKEVHSIDRVVVYADGVEREYLMPLPAVEERNEGHWINDTNYSGWTCTNCGYHDGCAVYKYCPNCGARMKGELYGDIHPEYE